MLIFCILVIKVIFLLLCIYYFFQVCITDTLAMNWPALNLYWNTLISPPILTHSFTGYPILLASYLLSRFEIYWTIVLGFLRIPVLGTNVILMYLPFSVSLHAPHILKYCFFDTYFKSELSGFHHFSMAGSTQRGAHIQNMNIWGRISYINYNKFIKCMTKGLFLV